MRPCQHQNKSHEGSPDNQQQPTNLEPFNSKILPSPIVQLCLNNHKHINTHAYHNVAVNLPPFQTFNLEPFNTQRYSPYQREGEIVQANHR